MSAYERLDEDLANWMSAHERVALAVWVGRWVLLVGVLVFIGLTLRTRA